MDEYDLEHSYYHSFFDMPFRERDKVQYLKTSTYTTLQGGSDLMPVTHETSRTVDTRVLDIGLEWEFDMFGNLQFWFIIYLENGDMVDPAQLQLLR